MAVANPIAYNEMTTVTAVKVLLYSRMDTRLYKRHLEHLSEQV
jgi:hypothetical protein